MIPEEYDSTSVIIIKMIIIVLTVVVSGITALGQGVKILRYRYRKQPVMGFRKGV